MKLLSGGIMRRREKGVITLNAGKCAIRARMPLSSLKFREEKFAVLPGAVEKSSGGMMSQRAPSSVGRWFCSSLLIVIPAKAGIHFDFSPGGTVTTSLPRNA